MSTECNQESFPFQACHQREVVARFDGGEITSDGGVLLLREVEKRREIIRQFACCFRDWRDPDYIEHTVEELIGQRVYGLALGYEDLNDHEDLRRDSLLAAVVGKEDVTGSDRRERDAGKPLAGKSTLNRLELTPAQAGAEARYKKIVVDPEAVDRFFVNVFIQAHRNAPAQIVLDVDCTDDVLHGNQEGRFFHGFYMNYCYLPLYIFCGDFLLCARLRRSNIDASAGTVEELERIIQQIRKAWPRVKIVIRGDSGFAREQIMTWCEQNHVDYVFGLAKNERLKQVIEPQMEQAEQQWRRTGKAARVFADFEYQTRDSWSRSRRVVGKAEHLDQGSNPRFVVTSLPSTRRNARKLYEKLYCARGEMENRIKEQQLDLFADRTSTATMRANQLRLWLSSVAYVLMNELRRLGLKATILAEAQCQTIRLKLLKIGAQIKISVRRIFVSLATGYPYEAIFSTVHANLQRASVLRI